MPETNNQKNTSLEGEKTSTKQKVIALVFLGVSLVIAGLMLIGGYNLIVKVSDDKHKIIDKYHEDTSIQNLLFRRDGLY